MRTVKTAILLFSIVSLFAACNKKKNNPNTSGQRANAALNQLSGNASDNWQSTLPGGQTANGNTLGQVAATLASGNLPGVDPNYGTIGGGGNGNGTGGTLPGGGGSGGLPGGSGGSGGTGGSSGGTGSGGSGTGGSGTGSGGNGNITETGGVTNGGSAQSATYPYDISPPTFVIGEDTTGTLTAGNIDLKMIPADYKVPKVVPAFIINTTGAPLTNLQVTFSKKVGSSWVTTTELERTEVQNCVIGSPTEGIATDGICLLMLSVTPKIDSTDTTTNRELKYQFTVTKGNEVITLDGRILFKTYVHWIALSPNAPPSDDANNDKVIMRNLWKYTNADVYNYKSFKAWNAPNTYRGGVRLAICDMNNDGFPDVITVPGPYTSSSYYSLKIFSGAPNASATPTEFTLNTSSGSAAMFTSSYKMGFFVACGDLNGDNKNDIALSIGLDSAHEVGALVQLLINETASPNTGTTVTVNVKAPFEGIPGGRKNGPTEFFGGTHLAIAKIFPGATASQLVVGAGDGGGPRAIVYEINASNFSATERASVFTGDVADRSGIYVSAFRPHLLDDDSARIVSGAGPGGGPRVDIFKLSGAYTTAEQKNTFAFDPAGRTGIMVEANMNIMFASMLSGAASLIALEPVSLTTFNFAGITNSPQLGTSEFLTNAGLSFSIARPPREFSDKL